MSEPDPITGLMSALQLTDRPSGAKLGIYAPATEVPTAPFTLAKIHVPVGITTAEDHHEVREIWLVQAGSGELRLDGEPMRVSKGDSLFFDSYHRHQLYNDGDEAVDIISVWWQP